MIIKGGGRRNDSYQAIEKKFEEFNPLDSSTNNGWIDDNILSSVEMQFLFNLPYIPSVNVLFNWSSFYQQNHALHQT